MKGGAILGHYPDDLNSTTNPLDVGRGRLIPTTPWEAVWNAVAQWFGVKEHRIDTVLPNRGNFPTQLFTKEDLFN